MKIKLLLHIITLILLFPKPAHAYLDPGTGSYLFQILIAGLFGSLFFIKSIFRGIKKFFKDTFKMKPAEEKATKTDEDR